MGPSRRRLRIAIASFAAAWGALATAAVGTACRDTEGDGQAGADAAAGADAGDAAADAAPAPRGARVLGLGLDLSSPGFFADLRLARDAGATTTNLAFRWDRLERPASGGTDAGAEAGTDAGAEAGADSGAETDAGPVVLYEPALHAVNLMLPDQGASVALGAYAVEADGPHLPVDLAGRALDDEAVLTRYEALEGYLFGQLPDTEVSALLVGDGVERALGTDAAAWARFATLVRRASARAKAIRPKVKVGFTVAAEALASRADVLGAALDAADLVSIAYVAVDETSRARAPEDAAADLARAIAAAPEGKPVLLRAVGYPSAAASGSSEGAQAAFIAAAFAAWDRAASRAGTLTFWGLDDADDARAAFEAAQAGRGGGAGVAAFASLGLRTAGGRDKPALGVLRAEARARGF